MKIGILRPVAGFSFSMDVYADGLVTGLKEVRPDWKIVEFAPVLSKIQRHPILTGLEKYYQRYWHHPRQLQQQQIDLFHVVDHSDGHLLYWLKQQPQAKVVTCHDLINLSQPETFKDKSFFPAVSIASWKLAVNGLKYADRVIAVSNHTAKDITQRLSISPRSIITIPNAVSSEFKPTMQDKIAIYRRQYNLCQRDFCLLNVGSNNLRKNVSGILEAIAILSKKNIPVHFWKAGADFDAKQKSFIAANNLDHCVRYLGKPDETQLRQIYNAADVLVAPSTYEGFGLTILEAMACGTPVITSNVTSLPEVAGDAAILVEPTDIKAIAAAISRLQAKPQDRQLLRDRGLGRVKQFSWFKTAERVARVYEQVLRKN